MSRSFSGTDIISEDDLTTSPWTGSSYTATLSNDEGPFDGASVYEVSVSSTGSYRHIRADNLTVTDNDYYCFLWIKGGTVLSAEGGVFISGNSWRVIDAEILEGPGSISVADSRWTVSGLSTHEWTLIFFSFDGVASSGCDFYVYPYDDTGQTSGDSVFISTPRMALESSVPGWSSANTNINTNTSSTNNNFGQGIICSGLRFINNNPHESLNLSRDRTLLLSFNTTSNDYQTIFEKRENDNNYWMVSMSGGSLMSDCFIDGDNLGASATNQISINTDYQVSIGIPASGNTQIQINGSEDRTSSSGLVINSLGSGIVIGGRIDGTSSFNGTIYDVAFLEKFVSLSDSYYFYDLSITDTDDIVKTNRSFYINNEDNVNNGRICVLRPNGSVNVRETSDDSQIKYSDTRVNDDTYFS